MGARHEPTIDGGLKPTLRLPAGQGSEHPGGTIPPIFLPLLVGEVARRADAGHATERPLTVGFKPTLRGGWRVAGGQQLA